MLTSEICTQIGFSIFLLSSICLKIIITQLIHVFSEYSRASHTRDRFFGFSLSFQNNSPLFYPLFCQNLSYKFLIKRFLVCETLLDVIQSYISSSKVKDISFANRKFKFR